VNHGKRFKKAAKLHVGEALLVVCSLVLAIIASEAAYRVYLGF
jgi:hypothetical protein